MRNRREESKPACAQTDTPSRDTQNNTLYQPRLFVAGVALSNASQTRRPAGEFWQQPLDSLHTNLPAQAESGTTLLQAAQGLAELRQVAFRLSLLPFSGVRTELPFSRCAPRTALDEMCQTTGVLPSTGVKLRPCLSCWAVPELQNNRDKVAGVYAMQGVPHHKQCSRILQLRSLPVLGGLLDSVRRKMCQLSPLPTRSSKRGCDLPHLYSSRQLC